MRANASPVEQKERIVLLDAIRGLAIFGILMVNMPLFFQPFSMMLQFRVALEKLNVPKNTAI
jgi:uncharacterized membrane protein YeiB